MTPLDPAELSAYLDGELSETRMREIAAMIAANPALGDELDALGREDATWRVSARSAAFSPVVQLRPGGEAAFSGARIVAFLALFTAAAVALRVLDHLALVVAINLIAAVLISIGVFVLTKAELGNPHGMPLGA